MGVRRSLLAIFVCLSVFLIDAAPAFTVIPSVIVYPFAGSSAVLDREASARIATTLASQISEGGRIKVIPPKSGVERATFLADARANGANYYVTGFITPLGSGASVVDQVVSTISGTMVFSVSNFVTTYADVVSQGEQLRQGILERASRGIQSFQAPPPQAVAPEPEPSKGTDVNISNIFGRKKRSSAAAPVALPANATAAILTVGGTADSDARAETGTALALAFGRTGRHTVAVTANAPANDVCTANKAAVQIGTWIDTTPGTLSKKASANLRMVAYDCTGKTVFDRVFVSSGAGTQDALSNAAFDAVSAYLGVKIDLAA
jgi:hypothetical protein